MKSFLGLLLLMTFAISSCDRAEPAVSGSPQNVSAAPTPIRQQSTRPTEEQLAIWEEESYRPLIQRWLNGEGLDGQFVELEWGEGREWVSTNQTKAKVELLDANADGHKELSFQTSCAPVGNCKFLLFQREGDSFRRILVASMVQTFKLRAAKSNGFHDVETTAHDSANSGGIAIYKYNGDVYKIAECFGYEYKLAGKTDRNGQSIVSERPTLTPASCSAWESEDP